VVLLKNKKLYNLHYMKSTSRQSIDRSLFAYGGLVSIIITVVSFTNIHTTPGLISFILFLPLSLYFLSLAFIYLDHLLLNFLNLNQPKYSYFGKFSFMNFFSQSETIFLVTILLFAIALSILLFKISLNIIHEIQ